MQALAPYFLWAIYDPNINYTYSISYTPILYWALGYLAFLLGALPIGGQLSGSSSSSAPIALQALHWNQKNILLILLVAVSIQSILVFSLYGGVPLLLFVTGEMDVFQVNELQVGSGFGQLGILLLTLFSLQALLLSEILIANAKKEPRPLRILFLFTLLVLLSISAGKRQGLFILVFFVSVGLSLTMGNPLKAALKSLGLPPSKSNVWLAALASIAILIGVSELVGSLRIGHAEVYERPVLVTYLELPLINFESQIETAGLGPFRFSPGALLKGFIPAKLKSDADDDAALRLPEPTAPSGFFGIFQWNVGLIPTLILCAAIGKLCGLIYRASYRNLAALFSYSQIAWALLGAHSYNHFLTLLFLPVPIAIYFVLAFVVTRSADRRVF